MLPPPCVWRWSFFDFWILTRCIRSSLKSLELVRKSLTIIEFKFTEVFPLIISSWYNVLGDKICVISVCTVTIPSIHLSYPLLCMYFTCHTNQPSNLCLRKCEAVSNDSAPNFLSQINTFNHLHHQTPYPFLTSLNSLFQCQMILNSISLTILLFPFLFFFFQWRAEPLCFPCRLTTTQARPVIRPWVAWTPFFLSCHGALFPISVQHTTG